MSVKYVWRTTIALALSCSSTPIEVGSFATDDGDWPEERSCSSLPQLPIVGTWVGYTDVPTVPSQSNAVRLVITHANGKRMCGTLTMGNEAPPWPPLLDSHAPYPPDLSNAHHSSFQSYIAQLEGVPRTIVRSTLGLPHVWFSVSYAQWKGWCAAQLPYRCQGVTSSEYYCIPVSGSGGLEPRVTHVPGGGCMTTYGGEPHMLDCGRAVLCVGGPCECTDTRCGSTPAFPNEYELDFAGDIAAGSGMHLTRMRL